MRLQSERLAAAVLRLEDVLPHLGVTTSKPAASGDDGVEGLTTGHTSFVEGVRAAPLVDEQPFASGRTPHQPNFFAHSGPKPFASDSGVLRVRPQAAQQPLSWA